MRLKELTEDFLEGGMVEVLKCEHCYCELERNQSPDNTPIQDVCCPRCHMHTDRGD